MIKVGSVVLYKGQPAVVTEIVGDKFIIEGDEQFSKKVRKKDFFILSEKPVKSLSEILNARLPQVDFSIAHEFFTEDVSYNEVAELFFTELEPQQTWKAWEAISTSPYFDVPVPSAPVKVRSPEEVEKLKEKEAEKKLEAVFYKEFVKEAKTFLKKIPQTKNSESKVFNTKKYYKFLQEIEQVAFGKINKSKILVDLKIKQAPENAHDFLLKSGAWQIDKNPYPQRFDVSTNDAKDQIEKPVYQKPFTDLTAFTSYAIDNPGSTDPDDAVCFNDGTLYIHVACPAETVTQGSAPDETACDKGATIFLPEQVGRMLNNKAVEYYALGLEKECFALTFAIQFDQDFELSDVKIFRSKISVERMTYEEAETKKDGVLKPLFELARNIFKRRQRNGAVLIKLPEVFINVQKTKDKTTIEIEQIKTLEASEMIREMMLVAGEAGAMFAFKNQIPFQFISQEKPTFPEKISEGFAGEYQKRRCMHSRTVSTVPSKHFALGLSMYAQLTSPLRRYADLISQQQILRFIDGEKLIDQDTFLNRLARAEIGSKNISRAARLSVTHWILVYLVQNPEHIFDAIVLEISGHNARVILPELGYETDINLKQPHVLNETFKVKAINVDLAFQKATFTEVK